MVTSPTPQDGRDVKVICTKQPGRLYATTEVRPRGKQSKLTTDTKQAKEWLDSLPKLDDLYEAKSYDALAKIVNDWLTGDDAETQNSEGTSRGSSNAQGSKTTTAGDSNELASKFKSLDDAFADLEDDGF